MIELYLLLSFVIIAAIVAIEINDMLSSVIAVGAVGLGVSMAFLILKAPDIAITQLVVEILCLIILVRATLKRDLPFSTKIGWLLNGLITFGFIIIFLVVAVKAFKDLPQFGYPIMRVAKTYIQRGLIGTGAANLVTSVILDFRAYDTLGEATILFTAVIGLLAVLRKIGRKKTADSPEEDI